MHQHTLSDAHLTMLREGSAIAAEVIAARGYRTVASQEELAALGFAPSQRLTPGLLIPLWTPGGELAGHILRPDYPRKLDKEGPRNGDGTREQKVIKYETPKDWRMRLDCPPPCRPAIGDPAAPLWITEGQKKADALASRGACALALLGVWNWRGRNDVGGTTILADWEDVALNDRQVIIAFDSDVMTKPQVREALERFTRFLQGRHAHVSALYLPRDGSAKTGIDDYFAAGRTLADAEALLELPRPAPVAALPTIRLLDGPPAELNRPLQLVTLPTGGHGFAAAWLYTEVTKRETINNKREVVVHNPPLVTSEKRLFLVRDDGRIYAEEAVAEVPGVDSIGLRVHLPETPREERLWSRAGVERFLRGERPDPVDVHRRIADVFDRFIDFGRSLAPQRDMCELAACYVMATYLLDGFTVTGYLWPTGERGSGKTQFLTLVSELGYLGHMLQEGASYASLRDLSDYGATLCFDEAENLNDPKTDPDKRALLNGGNRRGNVVTVKEPTPDRGWQMRSVRTFTPRCFAAIRTPDPVLASRAILLPLVRTSDKERANADALAYAKWPHNRAALIDDLWALGCAHVGKMAWYEEQVCAAAPLLGRSLEPWRTLLSVAMWLDECGAGGLYERLAAMAVAHQEERKQLERADVTALVIEAVGRLAQRDTCNTCDTCDGKTVTYGKPVYVTSGAVAEEVRRLIEERELDLDKDRINGSWMGKILGKLRFNAGFKARNRVWTISKQELENLMNAYGLQQDDGGCHENAVASVASVASVAGDDAPDPLRHPYWTPQLVAADGDVTQVCNLPPNESQVTNLRYNDDYHEEREDLLLVREPDWLADAPEYVGEDEDIPEWLTGYDAFAMDPDW